MVTELDNGIYQYQIGLNVLILYAFKAILEGRKQNEEDFDLKMFTQNDDNDDYG